MKIILKTKIPSNPANCIFYASWELFCCTLSPINFHTFCFTCVYRSDLRRNARRIADLFMACYSTADKFGYSSIAIILMGMIKLGVRVEQRLVFNKFGDVAMKHVDSFDGRHLSNVLWAFAKANIPAPELFNASGKVIPRLANSMNHQDIANILWAYAKMGIQARGVFVSLQRRITEEAALLTPQHTVQILWAYATLDIESPIVLNATERRIPEMVTMTKMSFLTTV